MLAHLFTRTLCHCKAVYVDVIFCECVKQGINDMSHNEQK